MVSNMPIGYNDPIVQVMIGAQKPRDGAISWRDVGLIYPGENWGPIGLPIFGRYSDYGEIMEVEETPAVEWTRLLIGRMIDPEAKDKANPLSLEQLVSRETDGLPIALSYRGQGILARTFMHRRVFDFLTEEFVTKEYDRDNDWKTIKVTGSDRIRTRLTKALEESKPNEARLMELGGKKKRTVEEAKEFFHLCRAMSGYKLCEAMRLGESDNLYGGENLANHDPALFLAEYPRMMRLQIVMQYLRRSYLPVQTIGEQHTPPERHIPFHQMCLSFLTDKWVERRRDMGEDEEE
ncbi:hypothetical protein [Methylobacterium indicum]|nr:hypothetical protein [Methylobacterium indicum]